jgi:hypothetical protein
MKSIDSAMKSPPVWPSWLGTFEHASRSSSTARLIFVPAVDLDRLDIARELLRQFDRRWSDRPLGVGVREHDPPETSAAGQRDAGRAAILTMTCSASSDVDAPGRIKRCIA